MKPYVLQENKWRIAPDGSQSYMLQRGRVYKGQIRWRSAGYFVDLQGCLKEYQHRLTLESDLDLPTALRETLQALQTAVDQLKTRLTVTL